MQDDNVNRFLNNAEDVGHLHNELQNQNDGYQNENAVYENIQNVDEIDMNENVEKVPKYTEAIVANLINSDDGIPLHHHYSDDGAMQVSMEEVVGAEEVMRISNNNWQNVMEMDIDANETESYQVL